MSMATSAFGVEHGGELSKGLASMLRPAKKAAKATEDVALQFKKVPPRTAPTTGPGSMRGQMDPSAWATRTAASRRSTS